MDFENKYQAIIDVLNGMDDENYRSMSMIIKGHEMWLQEPVKEGDEYSVELRFGHNMEPDGSAPDDYVHPTVIDCDGNTVDAGFERIDQGHRIFFKDTGKAPYTLYNESVPVIWTIIKGGAWKAGLKRDFSEVESSSAFQMYAKAIFSDGAPSRTEQAVLEIIPDKGVLKAGEETVFTILYEGKPLAGQELKFFCKTTGETRMVPTDAEGKAVLKVTDPGNWMILMRFRDETKSSEDEFDDSVFITTLVMKAE